jgi:hypothetical protein
MADPSDRMMELMAASQGGSMSDSAPSDVTPPMGAPMMTPEPKMGSREAAMINVGLALDLLEQALPAIGSESSEGTKVMAALRTLTGMMQPRQAKTNELKNAEILQLLQNLPQAGGGTPEGKAMASAPPVPGMAGGAMPPPMPAGAPPMPPPGGMPMPPSGGAMPM